MKRVITALALAATIGLAGPAPAVAGDVQHPIEGKMHLEFFGEACPQPHLPPFLTWAGTVLIDGGTYGWADFPTGPVIQDGKFISATEYWTIFSLDADETMSATIACDTERVLLAGENDAWGPPGFTAKADGTVTFVAEGGHFDEVAVGSRMFWRGRVTDDAQTQFEATLHIQPTR